MVASATFEAAYAAHGASVLRYAAYSTGSQQVADDIAAETWARYLEKGAHVPAERVEAWLVKVTRNLCVSYHRRITTSRTRAIFTAVIRQSDYRPVRRSSVIACRADGWSSRLTRPAEPR